MTLEHIVVWELLLVIIAFVFTGENGWGGILTTILVFNFLAIVVLLIRSY